MSSDVAGGLTPAYPARARLGMWMLLSFFLLASAIVNPFRETGSWSDDFSYARMVRHFLETGHYRLDHWAAADMPLQIYWGAALSKVFGYSLQVLRLSTLILWSFGLLAAYQLLRDFGVDDLEAGLLSLALLAGPVVMLLTFSFMTDVQFLSWMLISSLYYTRAIRQDAYLPMAMGALAAAAAVGTRQFGVALPMGLAATWLTERSPLKKLPLYLVGLLPPALAGLWQVSLGLAQPSFTQAARLANTADHLHRSLPGMAAELFFRLMVLLQYLGLFTVPLLPVLFLARIRAGGLAGASSSEATGPRRRWVVRSAAIFVLLFCGYSALYLASFYCVGEPIRRALMPSLYWIFWIHGDVKRLLLTLATSTAAVLLAWLLAGRYANPKRGRGTPREERPLVFTWLAMLALNLVYAQFLDTYLIVYIPFVIFAVGREAPAWPRWCRGATLVLCAATLVLTSLLTRGSLAEEEAYWKMADAVRSTGVAPSRIAGHPNWGGYHGAFDDWLEEARRAGPLTPKSGSDPKNPIDIHHAYRAFLERRTEEAEYILRWTPPAPDDVSRRLVKTVEYPGIFLDRKKLYLIHQLKK